MNQSQQTWMYKPRDHGLLEIHPFALLLPVAEYSELAQLKQDIRKHGVRVPIVLFEGKILDGRSRYQCANMIGEPVPVKEFEGSSREALDLVTSFNLYRRHLSPSQKAMVAAHVSRELQNLEGLSPKEAREVAAHQTGASNGYVERAERLIEEQPRVAKKVLKGEQTIHSTLPRSLHTCPACGHRW